MSWRKVKRAVFARHCHPLSAWSRWASTPLMLVPVWRRSWQDAAVVGAWLAVNPVVFGKPAHERAWSTRAILGEERWIEDRPLDAAMAVNTTPCSRRRSGSRSSSRAEACASQASTTARCG